MINFGSDGDLEFIGAIAIDNPSEFVHKVRFGQPGTGMPVGYDAGLSLQDVIDLLAYAQSIGGE